MKTVEVGPLAEREQAHPQTIEQTQILSAPDLSPLWRLHDPLCAQFLSIGRDPSQFPAVRAFFPFIRDVSLFQIPRKVEYLPALANAGFHAGFYFGRALPTVADNILDENAAEQSEALRRVRLINRILSGYPSNPYKLYSVFQQIAEHQWKSTPPNELLRVVIEASFNAFKAGMAAATLCRTDPSLEDFVSSVGSPREISGLPLVWRSLLVAPVNQYGQPAAEWLSHPLLRVAAAKYPTAPIQRDTIFEFFKTRLAEFESLSEEQCPIKTADWITAGLHYGEQLKREQPNRVAAIKAELTEDELRSATEITRVTLAKAARGRRAVARGIVDWYSEQHKSSFVVGYGRRLQRVIHCSDFAIWIPWVRM